MEMNFIEILFTLLFIFIIIMAIGDKSQNELIILIIPISAIILWISFENNDVCKESYFTKLLSKCNVGMSNKSNENKIFKKSLIGDILDLDEIKEINEAMEDKKIEKKVESILKDSKQKIDDPISENEDGVIIDDYDGYNSSKNQIYSEENYKYNLFDELGSLGDNKLAHKMKQMSNKNREAMDNFSRTYSKYSNINYFDQELKDASASNGWWDDDAHLSTKF